MGKTWRRQKNGRERGEPGNGLGHFDLWDGGRATVTKTREEMRRQDARREKRNRFNDFRDEDPSYDD